MKNIDKILEKIYNAKNERELFDFFCELQFLVENKKIDFFEKSISKDKQHAFSSLKNEYLILHFQKIFQNKYFLESFYSLIKYRFENEDFNNIPNKILKNKYFVNLFLNNSFYFIGLFSDKLTQKNIDFIGEKFWFEIKKLEKNLSYQFDRVSILNTFLDLIFDYNSFYKKKFIFKIDGESFYNTLKVTRFLIGNYLIDFKVPILLSNSFKKIINKKENGYGLKDSFNLLQSIIKKFDYWEKTFHLDNNKISSFIFYFEKKEFRKIIFLINLVVKDMNISIDFIIKNSSENLSKTKDYFHNNFSHFPEYKGIKDVSQWSNKSFLNTIKFFTILDSIKESDDEKWKKGIFSKCFSDWIIDLNENINYFLKLEDDFSEISKILKTDEDESIEYKATFGFLVEEHKGDKNKAKKEVFEKITKTIIAMANSKGGSILIGVVENFHKVKDILKPHIFERENFYFLDVFYSFEKEKTNLDQKKRELQDLLKKLTKERMDFLDNLFSFEIHKIFINSESKFVSILEIKVKKSDKNIFVVKDDNWIAIPKRLDGRTQMLNPVEEFRNKKISV